MDLSRLDRVAQVTSFYEKKVFQIVAFWQYAICRLQAFGLKGLGQLPIQKFRLYYGQSLRRRGEFKKAIAIYQEILNHHPDNSRCRLQLASLLLQQGRRQMACTVLPEAKHLVPADAPIVSPEALSSKTLHIVLISDCPGIYGAEQINHGLMCGLVKAGYRLTCIQSRAMHTLIEQRQSLGIEHRWILADDIYRFHADQPTTAWQLPWALADASETLQYFMDTVPDLLIFADGCIASNLAAKQIAAALDIPFFVLIHRVDPGFAHQFAPYLQELSSVWHQAKAVVTVSQENLLLLRKKFGLAQNQGSVILCGRPEIYFSSQDQEKRISVRERLGIPQDAIVVCTTARMDIDKGYQYQIDALRQLKQRPIWSKLYFLWIGTGSLAVWLKFMLKRWKLDDRVFCLGARNDVPDLLDASDIFVLPSQVEGMPLSVMEAMAKGLAVAATAVSGIPEELGNTGKLLPDPKEDAVGMVQSLVETLDDWGQDVERCRTIGKDCRERAEKLFQEEIMLGNYQQLIETIMLRESYRSFSN